MSKMSKASIKSGWHYIKVTETLNFANDPNEDENDIDVHKESFTLWLSYHPSHCMNNIKQKLCILIGRTVCKTNSTTT